ncbi:MAG: hypothetical protein IPJ02_08445 [Chitinophagaceae bacterium]|nr:hypothetical protein [Chitinophagaceae bacterium]
MLKNRFILFLILLILSSSCRNNKLWTKVNEDISSKPLTIDYVQSKFSTEALYSITNGQGDTLKQIIDFFDHFKNDKNYKVDKRDNKTFIIFNPNDQITSGPSVEIKGTIDNWYISDIRFGK